MRQIAVGIALLFLMSGCASVMETTKATGKSLEQSIIEMMTYDSVDESRPPKGLSSYEQEILFNALWQETFTKGQGKEFLKLEMAEADDALFIADYSGNVVAVDKASGQLAWEVETKLAISGGIGVSDEALFFGTTDAEVIALKLEDGDTLWTQDVSSEVLSIPRYAENTIITRTVDGAITALSAEDGTEKWSFVRDVPALSLRGTSSPVLKSGGVISGYANGNLVVLRLKDGMQIWESSVAIPRGRGALDRMVDVDADPFAGDRYVYAATFNGGLVATDIRSGEIAWRRPELSSFKRMAADWVALFVVDVDNHVWSIDQSTGAINWQQDLLEHRQLTDLVKFNEFIFTADFEGYLHVLSTADGRLVGRVKVSDSPIVSAPIVNENAIYIQDINGEVTAVEYKAFSVSGSDFSE